MLARLKEYKEVIALVVFFLGGLAWIDRQYPDRDDLAVVQCLLTEYMTLTQQQIHAQDLEKTISDLIDALNDPRVVASNAALSPALAMEIDRRRGDLSAHQQDLHRLENDMRQTTERLQRNDCGRVRG